jgi:hypothetical protein
MIGVRIISKVMYICMRAWSCIYIISSLAWFRPYEESPWDDAFSAYDFLFLERSVDRGEDMDLIRLPIFTRVVKLIKSAFNTCRTFFSSKKGNLLFTCLNFSFWLINFKADRRPLSIVNSEFISIGYCYIKFLKS